MIRILDRFVVSGNSLTVVASSCNNFSNGRHEQITLKGKRRKEDDWGIVELRVKWIGEWWSNEFCFFIFFSIFIWTFICLFFFLFSPLLFMSDCMEILLQSLSVIYTVNLQWKGISVQTALCWMRMRILFNGIIYLHANWVKIWLITNLNVSFTHLYLFCTYKQRKKEKPYNYMDFVGF